jgi:aspartyl-tRNA(Asn)/glutamyl-tRNA(Gln) amidotransferase subunit A
VKDPAELTLTEVAGALRRRIFSSTELTRWMLERIARWQPAINAFVRIEEDEALAAAKRADRAGARGTAKGALYGVPLAHKDMYYIKGKLSECGSKERKGWIAPATSTALTRLAAAGSFRIGALHMSEFAYSPSGHNSYLGPARNAWDPNCITGGSSSGSATAVAARLVPAALGSDTGGSIRLPAHFCGVTGFKPTYGRVSRANALPLSFSLDTVGPLAVSAEDAGLIMGVISGPDPLDPTTLGAPAWNAKRTRASPKGLRIGVPARFYVDDLESDVASALDATIAMLRKLGAKISQVELPDQTLLSRGGADRACGRGHQRARTVAARTRGGLWSAGAQSAAERTCLQRGRVP